MEYYKHEWLTVEELKKTFDYDPEGYLVWKSTRPADHFKNVRGHTVYLTHYAGKRAGKVAINEEYDKRCTVLTYKGTVYKFGCHQLIFFYHHGYVPELIDHIDGNYLNNKIENLQPLNNQLNATKAGMFSHNTSGYRGVRYNRRDDRWIVNIKVDGKGYHCGQYKCIHYAGTVYNYVAKSIFGINAFHNDIKQDVDLNPSDLKSVFFRESFQELIERIKNRWLT